MRTQSARGSRCGARPRSRPRQRARRITSLAAGGRLQSGDRLRLRQSLDAPRMIYAFGGLPENLASFCALLRRKYAFRIGSGELLDAARALDIVDLSSEQAVRSALRTILAGTHDDVVAFDEAFDRFFLPRPGMRGRSARSAVERQPEAGAGREGEATEPR